MFFLLLTPVTFCLKVVDSHTDKVVLDLYEAKGWHFKTKYYLDVYLEAEEGEEQEHFRQKFELIQRKSNILVF